MKERDRHKKQFWESMDEAIAEEKYEKSEKYDDVEKGISVKFLIIAGIMLLGVGLFATNYDNFNTIFIDQTESNRELVLDLLPEPDNTRNLCVHQNFDYKIRGRSCEFMDVNIDDIVVDTLKMQAYALEYLNHQRANPCSLEFINGRQFNFSSNRGSDCLSLDPVVMSTIDSAQRKTDNLMQVCGAITHWDTNGMKPYMLYSLAGGQGSVAEAAGGMFALDDDPNVVFYWTEDNLKAVIRENIDGMLYHDSHADWGHRDTLLDPFANKVNIGVSATEDCFSFMIHMERDYIEWEKFPHIINSDSDRKLVLSGTIKQDIIGNERGLSYAMIFSELKPKKADADVLKMMRDDKTPMQYGYGSYCTVYSCYAPEMSCTVYTFCVQPPCPDGFVCVLNIGWHYAENWVINCNGDECNFSITINIIDNPESVTTIVLVSNHEIRQLTSITIFR
jgi:hypothetical protein